MYGHGGNLASTSTCITSATGTLGVSVPTAPCVALVNSFFTLAQSTDWGVRERGPLLGWSGCSTTRTVSPLRLHTPPIFRTQGPLPVLLPIFTRTENGLGTGTFSFAGKANMGASHVPKAGCARWLHSIKASSSVRLYILPSHPSSYLVRNAMETVAGWIDSWGIVYRFVRREM